MQQFLQPITEQDCESFRSKCANCLQLSIASGVAGVGKGCELRGLLISFAT
jgi:hypothetical protein